VTEWIPQWERDFLTRQLQDELGQQVLPGMEGLFEYKPPAGHGEGQTSSQSEDWYTHPEVVTLVHELYEGSPDLDPMSCEEANKLIQAKTIYTAEQDGLIRPWFGKILWNPPWGGASESATKKRGLKKLLEGFENGDIEACVCVLNANAITTSWFAPLLDYPVCIPPKRIKHYGPKGQGGSPNSGTVIVYLGDEIGKFASIFSRLGAIMINLYPYRGEDKDGLAVA
jgi:hypothetical protein